MFIRTVTGLAIDYDLLIITGRLDFNAVNRVNETSHILERDCDDADAR